MLIARHAQVVSSSNVRAELSRMVTHDTGPVIHKLYLFLVLIQRTVTGIYTQGIAEFEQVIRVVVNKEGRHSSRVLVIQIQPGNARIGGRARIQTIRHDEHLVPEKAKAKIREQARAQRVIEPRGD